MSGPMSLRSLRGRDESGSAVVEFVWLGILLLVPLVWILLSVFEVQRGAFAVSAAARAAGRAYALAPDEATARQRATEAARLTLQDQGAPDMPLEVQVRCSLGPGQCLAGTSVVTVTIRSGVQLPMMPEVFRDGPTDFDLDAVHRVPIGQYVEGSAG